MRTHQTTKLRELSESKWAQQVFWVGVVGRLDAKVNLSWEHASMGVGTRGQGGFEPPCIEKEGGRAPTILASD